MTTKNLEKEIEAIKARNRRVEKDKAWETSWTRRVAISVATYIIALLFFVVMNADQPFLIAIVPTLGFLLSTLTVNFLKSWWLKKQD